ncbi:hypothetical protein [Geobacter sp. SVR]|uniref:hypothetical protein n=1 Tax=Geobacter sp. SVR TaxID=2495594 RepID=UPI00143EF779|nr:hypothetical protein [Geobacter sp. SVR]BCS54763.1 hypothetical protein GSVR_30710 [Geobacter sp. SVR]GCF86429.1 hypothetical protein GSbR_30290 [Geobacter sp. SVR]
MGIRMTIKDTDAVTLEDLLTQLPHSAAAKEARGYSREIELLRDLERNYSHQLAELARLSDIICSHLYTAGTGGDAEVMEAVTEIMQYVDAVRPGKGEKETAWVMHIIGPDDVIPCRGEFDALRKANQHNKAFAKLMETDSSSNDPYCVALAESI